MAFTPSPTTVSFGKLLRRYRIRAGLTQEALAERAGLSARGISDLERELKLRPRRDTVALLLAALDLSPEEQAALEMASRGAATEAGDTPDDDRPNLPVSLTSLIGRDREAEALAELLGRVDVRLVTLTGPGGVGKTRLAIRVADELGAIVPGGVRFVSLALVRNADLVLPAIAGAVGAREASGHTLVDGIVSALHGRPALLVLDNFEHVLEAAPVVTALLEACPGLTVLVTSRAVLRVSGEHVYALSPLALPQPDQMQSPEALRAVDAVRLFVDRAMAATIDVEMTTEAIRAIASICHRLDGLPLAIELAAARAGVMPPEALAARLDRTLPLLTGGMRDQPARMQTMRDTIAWSYDLLSPEEQAAFRRLAVFVGGFTLEAADRVGGGGDMLGAVSSLVGNSLLRRVEGVGQEPRYGMLETVREFGLERLAGSNEDVATRRAHAQYFAEVAEALHPGIFGPDSLLALARLGAEHANMLAALDWALASDEGVLALRLAAGLGLYWLHEGRLAEGLAWLDNAIAAGTAAPAAVRVTAYAWAAHAARLLGNYRQAAVLADAGIALARDRHDRTGEATVVYARAVVAHDEADFSAARTLYEEALTISREAGDALLAALSTADLGAVARGQGDFDQAEVWLNGSLAAFRQLNSPWGIAHAQRELGHVYGGQGDHDRSRAAWREGLAIHWAERDPWNIAWCLEGLAELAARERHGHRAALLYGAAERLREKIGAPLPQDDHQRNARAWSSAREALGEVRFAEAWADGKAMTLEEAVTEAMDVNGGGSPETGGAPNPRPASGSIGEHS